MDIDKREYALIIASLRKVHKEMLQRMDEINDEDNNEFIDLLNDSAYVETVINRHIHFYEEKFGKSSFSEKINN